MKKHFSLFILLAFAKMSFAQVEEGTLLSHWKDTTLGGSFSFDNTYNEIWGITSNGHEYAVIGSTFGTHFIDVTDPTNIFERFRFPGKEASRGIIHRDYHDYSGYLYAVADEGASSLQILKIDELPDTAYIVYDSDELLFQAHNIFIDTAHARLYTFAGALRGVSPSSGVGVIDISEPTDPKFVKHFREFGAIRPGHVHDGYVRDNIAFLNCEREGFAMMDYTDLDNPIAMAALPANAYLQSGYNHSGWANDDCSHYYFADENWGTDLKTLPLTDLEDLSVISYFDAGNSNQFSIPHNLIVGCDYLYASYYYDGLQVYDISNPDNPERVMFFNTSSRDIQENYEGAWGVFPHLPSGNILVSDMQEGLFVIEGLASNCAAGQNLKSCKQTSSTENSFFGKSKIEVFPNPISGSNLNIKITGAQYSGKALFVLTDINGSVLKAKKTRISEGEQTIDFSLDNSIKSGFYFIKIESEGAVFTKKVVVVN